LAGMTIDAATIIDPAYADTMNVAMNLYFIMASVVILTVADALVTEKVVELRLGAYTGVYKEKLDRLAKEEKKGLLWSAVSTFITLILVSLLILPPNAPLRGEGGAIIQSPFMDSLVPIIALLFFVPGLVYGLVTKEIKS